MISIQPIAFTFMGISVHWYGIMIAMGVLAATMVATLREKRLSLPRETTVNVLLIALPVAIVCARLYYVIFSWQDYAANPLAVLDIRSGGLAVFGGLIGGILTGVLYARAKQISPAVLADLAAPAIAIGQAFGRWGNFFNQEAYGGPILNEALQFFPVGVFINARGGWFWATFFYESVWCLLLCAALLLAERKNLFCKSGDMMLWYVLGYACERVIVEGLRTDSLYWGNVRVSQLLSAVLLIAVSAVLLMRGRKFRFAALLLPGALLMILLLIGLAGFAETFVLSVIQLLLILFAYYTIRKKADIP